MQYGKGQMALRKLFLIKPNPNTGGQNEKVE
jgi:hypothetical protein